VILTVSTTHTPATDLGYLLHKHPERLQSFSVSVGTAHVFYPEAAPERCTAALLLEVDPVGLVRRAKGRSDAFALSQYVNDRPYAATSMLSVALAKVFQTAMTGRCNARPELAASAIPLEIEVPALPCRGGDDLARRIFEPLGWTVSAHDVPLDPTIPAWGSSPYVALRLTGTLRLSEALNHLYVLLPVLDDAKHYWVSTDEVDKLVRSGGGWLAGHPERDLIVSRYLKRRRDLTSAASAQLDEIEGVDPELAATAEVADELPPRLAVQRRKAVLAALRSAGARRVGDLGCGEGALVADLLDDPGIEHIVAVDVSTRTLERAVRRLHLDDVAESRRSRLTLLQSSLTYRDERLTGLDAAVLMEVIEHIDLPRLGAVERNVFGFAAPLTVIVTTPNAEHNVVFDSLPAGSTRHHDHRFEWTRAEFGGWADRVAAAYGYRVRVLPVGSDHPDVGPPTQLAIFTKSAEVVG
jgi:3' terminal RNA ribose 2'-O-methyltransferase Hen1